ncbi:hypothetical protein CS078_15985 [Pseudomonas prosekii]|uniref:Uncharacterized protein n=1 Tax=Pseudomonas prosekii TaxID=1148509 RepID=A0A3L8CU39_9PSED|nr:hypothetical protein [Pseudomonas prosekii]RLU08388.1 hypothetical protein CS078_15985 [Pseudomonas prosekii]RLU11762.1 hypothetical protein CS076_08905 [Pseudomonas prosekii]
MSYVIHIEHREIQEFAWVEITGFSEEFRSARKCRFQTIGWILDIVDTVHNKVGAVNLLDDDYAINALIKYAKMDSDSAARLLAAPNWRKRFETAWEVLDDLEREEAVTLDYDYWHNFWPGFDTYNCTLRRFLTNYRPQILDTSSLDMSSSCDVAP